MDFVASAASGRMNDGVAIYPKIQTPPTQTARAAARGNSTYYVDAQAGDDGGTGTSRQRPWKSVARVNAAALQPGDRVLFAGGQKFAGTLRLTKAVAGLPDRRIVISSFGTGRATLDGGTGDGVTLIGCAYVTMTNVSVVGAGRKNGSNGAGIVIDSTDHLELTRIDVGGFRRAGILLRGDAHTRITGIRAYDNGFAGIAAGGDGETLRARDLYVGDCIAENNAGDPKNLTNHSGNGIVVASVDGALIEYCHAFNNGWDMPRDGNGPVGIWAWNCDRVTIQHCISHDNKSPGMDGGGFDFDGGVTNSVLQYNLSYDNVGCGYLLCQYPAAAPWKNNIVRYNISVNDGKKNLRSGIGLWLGAEGISDAAIYNNTIVNAVNAVATLGDVPGMVYRNNLFVAGGDVLDGDFGHSRFENNLYWSTGGKGAFHRNGATVHPTMKAWSAATGQESINGKRTGLYADPKIALPGRRKLPTDPRRLAKIGFFRPRPGSPAAGSGTPIPDDGGSDFSGKPHVAASPSFLGALAPQAE
jgi:hypothetical protein